MSTKELEKVYSGEYYDLYESDDGVLLVHDDSIEARGFKEDGIPITVR